MRCFITKRCALLSCLLAVSVLAVGCGKKPATQDNAPQATDAAHDGHDHDGWWCAEHGVPEEDCSICSSTAAAGFKEKGDWCEEHGRAESQCFLCDPSRSDKFAKRYEAKFGHAPPEMDK